MREEAALAPLAPAQEAGAAGADAFPLSFAQQRLWFIHQWAPDSAAYNLPVALQLTGALDAAALERSLAEIVRRHATLRTTYAVSGGEPVQLVAPFRGFTLPVQDVAGPTPEARLRSAMRLAEAEGRRPFDLRAGPVLRARLLRCDPQEHLLLLTFHHIAFDGWSGSVFFRELMALYQAFRAGHPSPLEPLPIQYSDFALWQRDSVQGDALGRQLEQVAKRLQGVAPLELPTDRTRPAQQTFRGGESHFTLPAPLSDSLQALARAEDATLFMLLLAGFQALLHRATGQEDFAVGSPIAGRSRPELEGLVGFFVNTLVLRADASGDPTFRDFLARVRATCVDAYAHQDVPFERIVEALKPERDPSRNPLVQVVFALQNIPPVQFRLGGLTFKEVESPTASTPFDLALFMSKGDDGIQGTVQYCTDLFDEGTVARMLGHLQCLLEAACAAPDTPLSRLPLMAGEARARLLQQGRGPRAPYPRDATVHALFGEVAARHPDRVAANLGGEAVTYRELEARANRLARHLRGLGVRRGVRVGVCLERGIPLVVAELAILKADGAYVPLDAQYPRERLQGMAEDTRFPVLVTESHFLERLPRAGARTLCLDAEADAIAAQDGAPLPSEATAADLAYIMFTSGSTGRPKGVAVPHRGIVRLVRGADYIRMGPDDVFLQLAPAAFDASTLEVWGALLNGARLAIAPPGTPSTRELGGLLAREKVTVLWLTAPLFHLMVDEALPALAEVRQLLAGGDALSVPHVRRALDGLPNTILVNGYGPTENTTFSCCHRIPRGPLGRSVPIGRPIANSRAYVLDRHGEPTPIGIPGELFVAGDGLALGYWERPELTAERFLPDPFVAGERMYRTGDLARWLPDGTLEFLGRTDGQVKVRGHRVETGEVEGALAAHPHLKEVAVVARDGPAGKQLVAYLVPHDGPAPTALECRAFLRERLPDHMVPTAFVTLLALPLGPTGKVDRRALPAPRLDAGAGHHPPSTPTEERLCAIWREVLRLPRVGVQDNFFALGGHSLLATQVASRVQEAFGVAASVRDVFAEPTIEAFARLVEAKPKEAADPVANLGLEPVAPSDRDAEERPPLSHAQERLWFIDQLSPGAPTYNIGFSLRLRGPLDAAALGQAFAEVEQRHESLRTVFAVHDGVPYQRILPPRAAPMEEADTPLPPERRDAEARRVTEEEGLRPFFLSQGPIWRARLVRFAPDDHLLAITLHHIAFDGWSMGHLMHELAALYGAHRGGTPSPLPPPTMQYREYAAWQRRYLAGGALDRQLAYWRKALADLPALSLPTDRLRPSTPSFRGGHVRLTIPPDVTERLRAVARDANASLFMVLLAGFQALLHRCTGQEDFAVGSPIAGRSRAELEGLIGFFVNTLVLRADARGDPVFRDLLARARATCLDAYAHQDVPFEKLVNGLAPQRDYSRTPLFQVLFHLQNASVGSFAFEGVEVDLLTSDIPASKFDLSLNVIEAGAGLDCLLEYATDLFTEETAARFAQRFQMVLEAVAQDPDQRLNDIPLLSAAEERALRDGHGFQAAEFPADRCIHDLVEERAAATPDATAVQAVGRSLTYGELERNANRLARQLRARGAGRGSLVGVLLDRDVGLSVGFLGVLKAGAAVVPLDPSLPEERLRLLAQDAGLRLVVAKAEAAPVATGLGLDLVPIEDALASREDGSPVGRLAQPGDPAYVMYTSGSTGTPKGVVVRHAGFMNSTTAGRQAYPHPCGRYALTSSIGFEASLPPLLWALADGGTTVLPPEEAQRDPALLAATIRGEAVTDLMITPSHYRLLLETGGAAALASLRQVTLVGEAWTGELVRLHHATVPQATLLNAYGPTETTMYCTIEALPLSAASRPRATLGRAIPNLRLAVLDPRGRPVPIGLVGELHIGGVGVTGAYLNRPELSRERFIPDPQPRPPLPGELYPGLHYRSGDLVRPLADGNLEFLGRADFQVKIRGHRVEPGEVEAGLARHPRVREAAVTAHGEGAGKRLVAYLALSDGDPVPPGELRAFLRRFLPEHMVPGQFVTLPSLPLNANGKVDRKRLPEPPRERPELRQDFVAPRDALEERLAAIWCSVLRLDRVGVHDNFFEVGGDSLSTVQVATRAQQAGLPLQLRHLFEHQTVGELAAALRGSVDPALAGPAAAAQGIQVRRGASLLAFNTQGKRRALFLVHPAGGTVGHFVALAHALGPAQPLYAVQAAGLEDDTPPHDSIAAMAEHYLALLRTVQPRGPYLVAGFSVGSLVALEMARQLRAGGEEVALLALLDPPLRHATGPLAEASANKAAVERLVARIDGLAPVAGRPAAEEAQRIAAERMELSQLLNLPLDTLQGALPPEVLARHMRVLAAHVRAGLRHRFAPCPGDALVLVSEETARATRGGDELRRFVAGSVEAATIPGGHFAMLAPPNVAQLSERLAGALAKATGPAAE